MTCNSLDIDVHVLPRVMYVLSLANVVPMGKTVQASVNVTTSHRAMV